MFYGHLLLTNVQSNRQLYAVVAKYQKYHLCSSNFQLVSLFCSQMLSDRGWTRLIISKLLNDNCPCSNDDLHNSLNPWTSRKWIKIGWFGKANVLRRVTLCRLGLRSCPGLCPCYRRSGFPAWIGLNSPSRQRPMFYPLKKQQLNHSLDYNEFMAKFTNKVTLDLNELFLHF